MTKDFGLGEKRECNGFRDLVLVSTTRWSREALDGVTVLLLQLPNRFEIMLATFN